MRNKDYPWGNLNDNFKGTYVSIILNKIRGERIVFTGMNIFPVMSNSPSNGYGLYDMSGNLWEWTQSIYSKYPFTNVSDTIATNIHYRSIRGGGRAEESFDVRVSFRGIGDENSRYACRLVL